VGGEGGSIAKAPDGKKIDVSDEPKKKAQTIQRLSVLINGIS
jgi:hypothetical protein